MFNDDYELLKPRKGDDEYGVYEPIDVDGQTIEIPAGRVHIEGILKGIAYLEIAEGSYIVRRKKKDEGVPLQAFASMAKPANANALH